MVENCMDVQQKIIITDAFIVSFNTDPSALILRRDLKAWLGWTELQALHQIALVYSNQTLVSSFKVFCDWIKFQMFRFQISKFEFHKVRVSDVNNSKNDNIM